MFISVKKSISLIVFLAMVITILFSFQGSIDNNVYAATEIIVDNSDIGCTFGGTWPTSTTLTGYYGANYTSDGTSGADTTSKWAKWIPNIIEAGNYNIYMRWTAGPNRPDTAPLEITYSGTTDTSKTINQTLNNGTWVLVGTYNLAIGTGNYVKLIATDAGYTIADAVKFEFVEGGTPTPTPTPTGSAFFNDIGVISSAHHMLPSIIAVDDNTVTIGAQDRLYYTTVPGGNIEKGAADIVTFRSTDKGNTWGSAKSVYQTLGADGDCGYSSVFVKDGSNLRIVYAVGPQNWSSDQLVVYQKTSTDGGDTWGSAITPTIVNDHLNAKPTNGGKGYKHTNGRLIIPGRSCLLYSDNGGSTWTATPEFGGHIEMKTQPYYVNGAMSLMALVPWRTQIVSKGTYDKVGIADSYSYDSRTNTTYGANNNFGFCRYDENTLLMTVTKDSTSSSKLYIRKSTDEGQTWTNEKIISGSAPSARYSDIAVMPDGTIVVVFIQNSTTNGNGTNSFPLRVVKFNMDWLMQ